MTIRLEYNRYPDGGVSVALEVDDQEDLTPDQITTWGVSVERLVAQPRPRPLSVHGRGIGMDIGAPDPEFLERLLKRLGNDYPQRWGERTQPPDPTPPPAPNASNGKSWLGRLRGV